MSLSQAGNQLLRLCFLFVGLSIMALGIALSVRADLGTTPISTPPLVGSTIFGLSLGTMTIAWNALLLLAHIAIRRRKFRPVQVLQLPVVMVFGVLIDASMTATSGLSPTAYLAQWFWCALGIVVVGVGVGIQVTARSLMLPGEGFQLAVSQQLFDVYGAQTRFSFGNVKVVIDSLFVGLSAVVSLIALGGLVGVREGTIVAALLVGIVAKYAIAALAPFGRRILGND